MDAFADLWDNTTGTPGQNAGDGTLGTKQQQLSNQPVRSMQATPPMNDAFSKLASAGSLANPPRQPTPRASGAVPIAPASSRHSGSPSVSSSPRAGGDPFSGLLSLGASTNVNMSMADRRAHAERERREREKREKARVEAQGAMWDQLDGALSGTSSATNSRTVSPIPIPSLRPASAATTVPPQGLKTSPGAKPSPSTSNGDVFWSLNAPMQNIHAVTSRNASPALVPQRATPNPKPADGRPSPTFAGISTQRSPPLSSTNVPGGLDDDLLNLDALAPTPRRPNRISDPFGFDLLDSSSSKDLFSSPAGSRSRTPGDFDFESREDLGQSTEDDDILGDLAKPIDEVRRKRVAPAVSNDLQSASASVSLSPGRTSPPPHIIGQIVEMGFTPQQAITALAATSSGVDVQEALDSLLAAHAVEGELDQPPLRPRPREPQDLRAPPTSRSRTQTPAVDALTGPAALNADKILAQATEIGSNLFSRANAFWKQGKEQMQKAYEEASKGSVTPPDGRPKWMQSAAEAEPVSPRRAERAQQSDFKGAYDDGTSELPQSTPRERKPSGPNSAIWPAASAAPSRKDDLASILSEDAPTYVSPHRRRPGQASTSARASPSPTPAPNVAAAPRRRVIQVDSLSSSALSSCTASRTKGTEKFKLGQFAEAEAAYTYAITCLPPNHALLIALYTNRAASRLKTGDSGGAAGDCTSALKIMGVSEDLGGIRELEFAVLDGPGIGSVGKLELKEQTIKAIQRRAAAFEAMERWERARGDWEKLAGLGWTNGKAREEAVRSAGRCRKMAVGGIEGGVANGDAAPAPKSKPKHKPPVRYEVPPSGEAVQKLQQAAAAQEAEDSLKADLKDSVDARITAWKSGKESNLRALIASLENVLWPELGWVKVGMHELVTPSQVKIRYTKAIAKVHPDKLKANTTVEQRMVANGVFSGLSDAWMSFKQ